MLRTSEIKDIADARSAPLTEGKINDGTGEIVAVAIFWLEIVYCDTSHSSSDEDYVILLETTVCLP